MEIGDKFRLTEEAIENYGSQWKDVVFTVESWANRPISAEKYFSAPQSYPHSHPGYDRSAYPQRLYDVIPDNGIEFNNSVYDWEVEPI